MPGTLADPVIVPADAGADGPFIIEPGVYRMTADQYHADPVVGGSLSSTGVRMLTPPNPPAKFRYYLDNSRTETKAMNLGRAAHAEVLGVGDPLVEIPFKDYKSKAAQTARDDARAAGCVPLLTHELAQVQAMAAALRADDTAGPLLARRGYTELVIVWRDRATGVWCRVMADFIPHTEAGDQPLIVDYKTTIDASDDGAASSMAKFTYYQQGPWYCDGLQSVIGGDLAPMFLLVTQEKEGPHLVTVHPIGPDAMTRGHIANRKALDVYAECVRTGRWPGYPTPDTLRPLELPYWQAREWDRLRDAGAFDVDTDLIGDADTDASADPAYHLEGTR